MAAVIQFPRSATVIADPSIAGSAPLSVRSAPQVVEPVGRSSREWARWLLAACVLVVIGALVVVQLHRTVVGQAAAPAVASGEFHVVGPGETLWSIAADLDPVGPRAPMVGLLAELNGDDGAVELGDVLALPVLAD